MIDLLNAIMTTTSSSQLNLNEITSELLDYDYYDGNYSIEIFNWVELIPVLIVYGFSFILGLTGNCLIIFTTFRYRRMHSVTNVMLSSLASSDLLLIIFCIPVKVAKLFSYTWTMGAVLCKGVHYMQNLSAICSVFTLTAISIERYYAIVHPVRSKYTCTLSHTKTIIIIIWIASILLAIPTLSVWVQIPVGENNGTFWCMKNDSNELFWKIHEVYLLTLILVIPFTIMAYSYTYICYEIWKVMEHRCVMTNDHSDDTTMVKQVIYMLVTVVALFAICWTPPLIDSILTAYGILSQERIGPSKHMLTAFHLMAYFNSCINPIIYGFMSKSFRESFKLALCCSSESNTYVNRTGSNYSMRYISRNGSQTRTTADTRRQESTLFLS